MFEWNLRDRDVLVEARGFEGRFEPGVVSVLVCVIVQVPIGSIFALRSRSFFYKQSSLILAPSTL
jgi:hypothetical protein